MQDGSPSPPALRIAPVAPELIEGFHAALDAVARERRFLTLLEAPPLPETRAFVMAGRERGDIRLLALVEGAVVGWVDIQREPWPSHAHRGHLGIGLLPAWRGRGFGGTLIAAALDEAWVTGLTRVELTVHADNAPAIALYERLGFAREGLIRRAAIIDGRAVDAILMARLHD